jgi:uncharacterized protein (DUF1330 family)
MKAYVIGDITVNDVERYKTYIAKAPSFVAKYEGKYLVRGGEITAMEGDWRPSRLVVLEFPSMVHAQAFANDPAYQEVAIDRRSATSSRLIIVEGTA